MDPSLRFMVANVMSQTLGAYVHVPFCIQRCHYCDFATYAKDQISPNDQYVEALCSEIRKRRDIFSEKELETIYFGGGTPSLLDSEQIKKILEAFKENGYVFSRDVEITLEVNPATLNYDKCEAYKSIGVNRLSIGCQSFNDSYLKACNREHNADDTRNTIELVKKFFSNFSLDLLFSLPKQGLAELSKDIDEILEFNPPHVSAYCLTLPAKHPLNQGRCSDEEQIEMFKDIFSRFESVGMNRYEISNFSKPGFESRHNNLYWTDKNYWGVGLSAHSYKKSPPWGQRFWNPSSYEPYMNSIALLPENNSHLESSFGTKNLETLKAHESLTDFCHTHLRLQTGIDRSALESKFGTNSFDRVLKKLTPLIKQGLILEQSDNLKLSPDGVFLSNLVFANLLFSEADIDKGQMSPLFW